MNIQIIKLNISSDIFDKVSSIFKKDNHTKAIPLILSIITILPMQLQANKSLTQCDYNADGRINGRTYLKEFKKELQSDGDYSEEDKEIYKVALKNAKKERKCKKDIVKEEIAQIKQDTAQKEAYIAKLDMRTRDLKEKLKKLDEELNKLTKKDKELIKELNRQKKWLLEQIRKTQKSFK